MRVIKLQRHNKSQIERNLGHTLWCSFCGKELIAYKDETIMGTLSNVGTKHYYHVSCHDKLFVDEPTDLNECTGFFTRLHQFVNEVVEECQKKR